MNQSVETLAACKAKLELGNMSEDELKQIMLEMVTSVGQAFEHAQSSMHAHENKTAETAVQVNATTARANDAVQQLGAVHNAATAHGLCDTTAPGGDRKHEKDNQLMSEPNGHPEELQRTGQQSSHEHKGVQG